MRNAFEASGSSPTVGSKSRPKTRPDFSFQNHGSICILTPITPAAKDWFNEHVAVDNPETLFWAGGIAIEPRYVPDIVSGIQSDGLSVAS
jgi:hypothetical protein